MNWKFNRSKSLADNVLSCLPVRARYCHTNTPDHVKIASCHIIFHMLNCQKFSIIFILIGCLRRKRKLDNVSSSVERIRSICPTISKHVKIAISFRGNNL